MSVTIDQVAAVRSALADEPAATLGEYDDALGQLDSYIDRLRFRQAVSESPHAALARQMYERVADAHAPAFDDATPRNGHHWLLAAQAAHEILAPKPEPRVFRVGDPEPEDRDTIAIRSTTGKVLRYGQHSTKGTSPCPTAWWWVNRSHHNTHGTWDYWLDMFGPFTEVVE
ncbi:hypothetical protein ACH47B_13085 [Rhodococcus sp. NPDC019627]|uniref:hypothetical protein n=1 Tax=unclassified Rhodococcus (in: high G+C Gram-positive bacteria) TaxID=192944 RepID=UPI0033D5BADB